MVNATADGVQYLRGFAVHVLRDAELPHRQVTVMHRDIFRRAGIEWLDGQSMDTCLAGLSPAAARPYRSAPR